MTDQLSDGYLLPFVFFAMMSVAWVPVWSFFLLVYISVPWSKMTVLIEINNGQPIPLMWYIFILLFFRILALENTAKILTTGPRL